MFDAMNWIFMLVIDKIYRVVRTLLHYVLAYTYGFYGRKVPAIKNPILQMSATELAKKIREKQLTSESVVRSYIERINEVEPFINATVDCPFIDAVEEAKKADSLVASGTMTKEQLEKEKPLLGVPFSVKVLLTVKGLRSTAGSLLLKNIRAQEDAATVRLMKAAGGIVLATTNCSESGTDLQSSNKAHGTTCNPYNTSRTSGGSTGGESALIAAAGSVIGLGNDLAGSIRIPCMFTGLFGHKPSRGLVPNEGIFPVPNVKVQRCLSTGPMCRYAEDLVTTMKILSTPKGERNKFGEKVDFKNIKVYYLLSYGDVALTEKVDCEIQNAVNKVVLQFAMLGSKVEETDVSLFKHNTALFVHKMLSAMPNLAEFLTAGKAKLSGVREVLKFMCLQSNFTLAYVCFLNVHRIPLLYDPSLVDFYKNVEDKIEAELHSLLDENSILVMPTLPFPAPYKNEITILFASTGYTSIFNVLGMPSTQCPAGLNKEGLPVGVQIVGRRGNDHLTIAAAQEIEKALGGWKPPM